MGSTATIFFKRDGERCQQYHETIVTRQGTDEQGVAYVTCHCGGWVTVTTKARINAVINAYGWNLYQEKNQWLLHFNSDRVAGEIPFTRGETGSEIGPIEFLEGIKLWPGGYSHPYLPVPEVA